MEIANLEQISVRNIKFAKNGKGRMSMTENEAIKVFKELLDVPCEMLVKYDSVTTEEQKKALVKIRVAEDMAIQALEEIQECRAIGTIEEFKALKEKSVAKHEPINVNGGCIYNNSERDWDFAK